jgi:WD40 repeat protein
MFGRRFGAVVLAGFLAGPTAPAVEPARIACLGSDLFRQKGSVEALVYSPDQKHLVTSDTDRLHLWDVADGRRLWTVAVENHVFQGLRFTPDGKTLYAAAESGGHTRLCRIDPATGKVLDNRLLVTAPARGSFGPDAAWLALKQADGKLAWIVEVATDRVVWSARAGDDDKFGAIAWRPDGRVVAIGDFDERIRLVDAAAGKMLADYKIGGGVAWNMAFSPDGKDLVAEISSPVPNHVLRFEAATGKVRWKHETNRAKELAFTPDGSRVFYYGTRGPDRTDPTLWHWLDAATGKPIGDTLDADYGHEVAVRPDGKVLAVGGFHGHISQWDLTTCKRLAASADPPGPVTDLRFSADGSKVRGWSRGWYEWDVKTGAQTRLTPPPDLGPFDEFIVSDDQRWLAKFVGRDPRTLELIDLKTGVRRHTRSGFAEDDRAHFLPDGRLIEVREKELRVFDPRTGVAGARIPAARGSHGRTVAADGTTVVVVTPAGEHLQFDRRDLATGRQVARSTGRLPEPNRMQRSHRWQAALSPDARVVAVSFDHAASSSLFELHTTLFNADTGRYLSGWWDLRFRSDLVFSPDGRTVACLSSSVLGIGLQETATGKRRVSGSFSHKPHACQFSPDGRFLAVSAAPGPVEIWDLVAPARWDTKNDLWAGLANSSSDIAYAALCSFRNNPAETIPLLKARVTIAPSPAADWIAARIKNLDSPTFRHREQATKELAAAGETVLGALRTAQATASAEARERLNGLIARAEAPSSEKLRTIRACEVLEGIGTPAARELLTAWAKGPAGATLTREANESLERLKRR